ncbi:hypothetical protein BSKO_00320 [Bryopsis sp. KO-2023]|nr:hypothetical protein BSKO_00320 [Bryopsis sp. KO-2023]
MKSRVVHWFLGAAVVLALLYLGADRIRSTPQPVPTDSPVISLYYGRYYGEIATEKFKLARHLKCEEPKELPRKSALFWAVFFFYLKPLIVYIILRFTIVSIIDYVTSGIIFGCLFIVNTMFCIREIVGIKPRRRERN